MVEVIVFAEVGQDLYEPSKYSRSLLLLRRQGAYMRLVDDEQACIFTISSGFHKASKVDGNRPIEDVIMDIAITPGSVFDPAQFHPWAASSIAWSVRRPLRLVQFLDILSRSPSRVGRDKACAQLVGEFLVRQSCLDDFLADSGGSELLDGPFDLKTLALAGERSATDMRALKRLERFEVGLSNGRTFEDQEFDIQQVQIFLFSDNANIRLKALEILRKMKHLN